MNIFIYAARNNTQGDTLRSLADKQNNADQLVYIENASDIDPTLRLLLKSQDIAILSVTTAKELDTFLNIRSLFQDVKLILVLSRNDPDLITKGHLLRPRFLYVAENNNFSNVSAVLEKMLKGHSSFVEKLKKSSSVRVNPCCCPSL
jgi:hypothetical protein